MKSQYKYSTDQYINNLIKHDCLYFEKILEIIQENAEIESSILDHGCGTGNLVKILTDLGFKNVVGIDLDKRTIERGKRYFKLSNIYTTSDFCLHNKKYDIVISNNVIEHVEDMRHYIDICVNLLNLNGYLIISTPNYLNPKNYFYYIKQKWRGIPIHITPFNDCNFFKLFFRLIKSSVLIFNKLLFNNTKVWKVTPLDPAVSTGGDADATWVSNYLDIRNYCRSKNNLLELNIPKLKQKISTNIYIAKLM